jgi:protein-disulfide isomerase
MSSSIEGDEGDLTRKQRREQARAERKALEESEAAAAKRRGRLMLLGGIGAAVVAIVVVIVVATSGGSKSGLPTNKHEENATVTAISGLLDGIPQSGNALGSPTAPVTLKYFGDLECPICKEFTIGALPQVIPTWVRTGKLRIEYNSMSTATGNAESEGAEPSGTFNTQQIAAYAAGRQNKAWNFIETFYHEQGEEDSGYVNENFINGIAAQVPGLDLAKWHEDRADPALAAQVETDKQAANNEGFTGTPSFLIGHTGGTMTKLSYPGSPGEPQFVDEAVEKLLKTSS